MFPQQTPEQKQASFAAAGLNPVQQSGVNAGIGYVPINSTTLAPQSQIQMPPAPVDNTNYSGIVGGTQANIATNGATLTPPPVDTVTQDSNALFQSMMEQITAAQPQSSSDRYSALDSSSNIQAKTDAANLAAQGLTTEQGKLAALQASLNGKNYEFNTVIPNQAQQSATGQNGTQAGVNATTVSQQRQKLLEIAPLQLQVLSQQAAVAAAQGNASLAQGILQSAQQHVDKIFLIQSQDAQAQYEYKTKQIEAVYNFASAQQKASLDAKQKQLDQDHADQQALAAHAKDLSNSAIENGKADLAGKITALDPKSPTYRQDLAALEAQMPPDALRQLQIKNAQLQNQKIQNELNSTGSDSFLPVDYTAFLSGLTPAQQATFNSLSLPDQASASQLLNGDALISDIIKARGIQGEPATKKLINQLQAIDPTFSVNSNKVRYTFMQQWNNPNGKASMTRNALNTALGHLADFKTNADTLDAGEIKKLNSVKNILSTETGDPRVLRLRTDINALATEVATAYKGGQPTEAEIQDWKQTIAADFSKSQFRGVSNELAQLLSSKITASRYQYSSTMGREYGQTIIDPEKKQALLNVGVDPAVFPNERTGIPQSSFDIANTNPTGMTVTAPDGKLILITD